MRILVASVLLALFAAPLAAQQLNAPRFQAATTPVPPALAEPVVSPAPTPWPMWAGSVTADEAEAEGFSWRPVLHAVGGALVGGWVGYVGAQVVRSDWDKSSNGELSDQRSTWVAAGAAVGLVGSWLIGETRSPRPVVVANRAPAPDRNILTTAEIRDSGLQTALEVVQALRRDWLLTRGTNSWGESARGVADQSGAVIIPGRDKIIVYLDDVRIGGVDAMAEVQSLSLTSIRFLDGRQATFVYGTGHAHGAIVLSTEVRPQG